MPIVPFTQAPAKPPGLQGLRPPPDEPFALMAAATMHNEGRLLPNADPPTDGKLNGPPNGYKGQGLFQSTIGVGDYAMPRAGKASDYKVEGVDK
jgi:hypothetical protein